MLVSTQGTRFLSAVSDHCVLEWGAMLLSSEPLLKCRASLSPSLTCLALYQHPSDGTGEERAREALATSRLGWVKLSVGLDCAQPASRW